MARKTKVPLHEDMEPYWKAYKDHGDLKARENLIISYEPLVGYVSSRLKAGLPANVEQQDLHSYGLFGLMDAIEKFDLERNIKFQTYAISRIHGAIIDELRSIDWIPRSVRSKARAIEKTTAKLENKLNRTPTMEEVAQELQFPIDEMKISYMQVNCSALVALDELLSGVQGKENLTLLDTLSDQGREDPESSFITKEVKHLMARAINRLEQREQIILNLYYIEGLTLSQIGTVLDVTESRVCQLQSQTLTALRQRLSEGL